MLASRPPMGFNTWNTFGENINEQLIREIADVMVDEGYLAAGYEYLVIDDCWALRERDENGLLVPDPEKFPHGMKAVADYVHSRGLKFGMYSCAGVMTCAKYPGSYDHEFSDARQFAQWGVDYLKYDFCNFPISADCITRYQTMSMALKASGREILFAACNWGQKDCWNWMRSVGAHMYRSTGDIFDNFVSFTDIFKSQIANFGLSAPGCFNDIDMLTVGMAGNGNVAVGKACTETEYRMEFALWCLSGAPLMIGADIRKISPAMKELLLHPGLIAVDQDEECRPPLLVSDTTAFEVNLENPLENGQYFRLVDRQVFVFFKHLSGGEFILGFFNMFDSEQVMQSIFADCGIPYSTGIRVHMTDLFTGEDLGNKRDYYMVKVPAHDCRMYRCRMVTE